MINTLTVNASGRKSFGCMTTVTPIVVIMIRDSFKHAIIEIYTMT